MKTFIANIIPSLQRYSQQLDNLTLLTDKHWVVIDEIDVAKNVYIFRKSGQLLISQNGKAEKASWEYLGNNSILIDRSQDSYLFRHGFFDENILALKVDGKEEYAFMVNENKYEVAINSFDKVIDSLVRTYIDPMPKDKSPISKANENESQAPVEVDDLPPEVNRSNVKNYKTTEGSIIIENGTYVGSKVYINGSPAPSGKYRLGFLNNIYVHEGKITATSFS